MEYRKVKDRGVSHTGMSGGKLWRFRVLSPDGMELLGKGLVHAADAELAESKVRGCRASYRDAAVFIKEETDLI